jgi:hypothetical protein
MGYRRGRGKEPLFSGGPIYRRRDKGQNLTAIRTGQIHEQPDDQNEQQGRTPT